MTDKQTKFMQEFSSRFTPPSDWGQKARDEKTSTLPLWLDWIDQERTGLDLVLRALDTFHTQGERPRLYDVKRAYGIMCGRNAPAGHLPVDICQRCDGTGILNVPCAGFENRNYVITRPGPWRYVFENSAPCRCSAGQRVNARIYRYAPALVDRCARARMTPCQIQRLAGQCRELVAARGAAVDDTPAPAPDAERDGEFANTQEMDY